VDSADSLHLQIEAMKLAFADIYEYVSVADTMRVKNADLLDKEYLRTRSRLIDMKKAQMPQYGVPASGGTVYLAAADATGMMISYIQSNYQGNTMLEVIKIVQPAQTFYGTLTDEQKARFNELGAHQS
jgi:gamma-glutamyltranspeptidase/glutathione hydrolase